MRKIILSIVLCLSFINIYSMPFWVDSQEVVSIDSDKDRVIKEIYLRVRDFGGDAFVQLTSDNGLIGEKKEIPKYAEFLTWENIKSDNENLSFVFSGEKALVMDFGILYQDSSILEENIKKYQFELKHYDNQDNIFSFREDAGRQFLMFQVFQLHCITCQEKLPFISDYAEKFRKTRIISMNAGENPDDIDFYFNDKGIELECIVDSDYEVCRQLEVYGVPHTIFFDLEGNILLRGNLSTEEIEIKLDELERL